MKLGGVIYLQSIADKRMKGTTRRNLDMFCQLCGDKAFERVVLGTTNWGEVDKNVAKKREHQLTNNFWNTMIALGSRSLPFDQTKESARAFLDVILSQLEFGENEEIMSDKVLRIQNELVELDRKIPETSAGQELRYSLKQLREMQEEGEATALAASIEKQIADLRISLPRRLMLKFFVSRLENSSHLWLILFFLALVGLKSTCVVSAWCAHSSKICIFATSIRYYNNGIVSTQDPICGSDSESRRFIFLCQKYPIYSLV